MRPFSLFPGNRRGNVGAYGGYLAGNQYHIPAQTSPAAVPTLRSYLQRAPDEYEPHPGEMALRDPYRAQFQDEHPAAIPHDPAWVRGDPIRIQAELDLSRPSYWTSPMTERLFAALIEQSVEAGVSIESDPGIVIPLAGELPSFIGPLNPVTDLEGTLGPPVGNPYQDELGSQAIQPLAEPPRESGQLPSTLDQLVMSMATMLPLQPEVPPDELMY